MFLKNKSDKNTLCKLLRTAQQGDGKTPLKNLQKYSNLSKNSHRVLAFIIL
jgi:hypothetical protein